MTRKNLPMSALITGLLAVPALGLAPQAQGLQALGANSPGQSPPALVSTETFPAEMPAEIALLMRRLSRGQTPDSHGMQSLQSRLALNLQKRLANTPKPK